MGSVSLYWSKNGCNWPITRLLLKLGCCHAIALALGWAEFNSTGIGRDNCVQPQLQSAQTKPFSRTATPGTQHQMRQLNECWSFQCELINNTKRYRLRLRVWKWQLNVHSSIRLSAVLVTNALFLVFSFYRISKTLELFIGWHRTMRSPVVMYSRHRSTKNRGKGNNRSTFKMRQLSHASHKAKQGEARQRWPVLQDL